MSRVSKIVVRACRDSSLARSTSRSPRPTIELLPPNFTSSFTVSVVGRFVSSAGRIIQAETAILSKGAAASRDFRYNYNGNCNHCRSTTLACRAYLIRTLPADGLHCTLTVMLCSMSLTD